MIPDNNSLPLVNFYNLTLSVLLIHLGSDNGLIVEIGKWSAFAGRSGIAGAFAVLYVFTGELYPTMLRNSGMGVA